MSRVGFALAVHELSERIRDRWVLVISALFALLASGVSLYGRVAEADVALHQDLNRPADLSELGFSAEESARLAGVDVMPRHYATFWECLAQMTSPTLGQADWRIG